MNSEGSDAPKLIVGYDGRERSDDALVLGRALSDALKAELVVAAAVNYEPAKRDVGDYNQARDAFFADAFDRAASVLGAVEFSRVQMQDTPAHGLHRLAESLEAAMVVVGSSHRGPAGRIFPGSVAERLLHGSPCPVAIAPAGYSARDGWIESIAVGVDGRPASRLATEFAVDLARRLHARLTLLRVGPDIHWATVSPPPLDEIDTANRRALKAAVERIPGEIDVDSHYCIGDPAEALIRYSAPHGLLVLGSRGYGPVRSVLLGGVSSFVLRNAATPVVVVPRGMEDEDSTHASLPGAVAIA